MERGIQLLSDQCIQSLCLPFLLLLSVNFIFVSGLYAESPDQSVKTDAYLNQSMDTVLQASEEESSPNLNSSLTYSSDAALGWFLVKVLVVLGVLTAVIFFGGKFLKQSGMTGAENEIMGIRSTLPLGQNQYLQIVQVGPQYYMLGVTENQVSMLGELEDTDTIQSLRMNESDDGESNSPEGSFQKIIQQFTGSKNHQFTDDESTSDLDQLKEKINQIDTGREHSTS